MKIYNYRRIAKHMGYLEMANSGYLKRVTSDFVDDLIKTWNDEHPEDIVTKRTFNCGSCLLDRANRMYKEVIDYEINILKKR